ncbi:SDR family oxidoreductase [Baekduia soli]|uniref:SDR family oxidoreductase n=1 Tax=Baekduia soli TaxID=496014 RepID=A0A5B8UA99_9ACTN|nr:SDR family NAD(P)-dependent oxidoreductase [Baekduia soli]QEC49738.1 SDR family oxidoreductase [Baekduia soli]
MPETPDHIIDLSGDVALVTGAGSGIARATALMLGAAGAAVLAADIAGDAAEATAEAITAAGGTASAVSCDVTDDAGVEAMVAAARTLGSLGIVVNAAGIAIRKGLLDTTREDWDKVIATNLTGYFNVLRATVPDLEASGNGRIVQIASVSAHLGYGYPSYTASKGGVLAMSRQLAAELAPKGIRINSVSPGVIETGINRGTLGTEAIRGATIGITPLGRLGQPEDIARTVLYLVSPLGAFVTGTDLVTDGGMISTIHWGAAGDLLQTFDQRR